MLSYIRASLLKSSAQTLVNPVNIVGVMGKGLAAEFRARFPEMFDRYREICNNDLLDIGKLWLWKSKSQWVLNFPTKRHWREPSRIEYIERGLQKFVSSFEERGITEIAFPRLGCGNGGLDWGEVGPLMEHYLKPLPIPVYIHDHQIELGLPEHAEFSRLVDRQNSFQQFWSDLKTAIEGTHSKFRTIKNNSDFEAEIDSDSLIIVRGNGRERTSIPQEEFGQIWALLNRGVLTRSKLTGKAYSEAYYLIPVIATLPYVRPVEIERAGKVPAIGLEMSRRTGIQFETVQGEPSR